MSRPEFTADRGIFRVAWDAPEFVRIDFDLLRSERSGELTGEATIHLTSPGMAGLLHQARINLTSTSARGTLARYLAGRTNGQALDWPGLIDDACTRTLRAYRAGEPAIMLRDAPEPIAHGALLPPLVAGADEPTGLFGDGGAGKSYLALAAGLAIHTGEPLAGFRPVATRRVAYLDWEWAPWPHRERMRALCGPGDLPDLLYVPCRLPLVEEADRLRRIFRAEGIGYAVLDSVALGCDGPPEEAATAVRFFGALRRLEVGALLVAHVNRSGDDSRPFGSAFWHNSLRQTWYVKRQSEAEDGELVVGLFNRKSNAGPLASPIALRLVFADGRTRIEAAEMTDDPDLAAKLPVKVRMLRALRGGSLPLHEIASEIGADVEAVRLAAKRGEGATFVRLLGQDGVERWGLRHAS